MIWFDLAVALIVILLGIMVRRPVWHTLLFLRHRATPTWRALAKINHELSDDKKILGKDTSEILEDAFLFTLHFYVGSWAIKKMPRDPELAHTILLIHMEYFVRELLDPGRLSYNDEVACERAIVWTRERRSA